jgi:carboxypeptidase PM20D1
VLRNIARELASPRLDQDLTSSYRALLRDTIAVTRISGGVVVNAVPATASADVDIRLLPDEQAEPMLQRVREAAAPNAEVEVLVAGEPAPSSSIDTDLYRILERDLKREARGSNVAPIVGAGATDSRYFRARGIVAYGFSPFKVNAYDAGTTHAADERIRAGFFAEGVRLTRRIVSDFCARP